MEECAELEVARKDWELEKDDLLSQVVVARKKADEVIKAGQMTEQTWKTWKKQHLWNAKNTNLEGIVVEPKKKHELIDDERKLQRQKNTELSTEVQSLKVHLNESESKLNDPGIV